LLQAREDVNVILISWRRCTKTSSFWRTSSHL